MGELNNGQHLPHQLVVLEIGRSESIATEHIQLLDNCAESERAGSGQQRPSYVVFSTLEYRK